jgi:hypothetical protein
VSLASVTTRGYQPGGGTLPLVMTLGYGLAGALAPLPPPVIPPARVGGAPVWWCDDDEEECERRRRRKYSEMTEERLLAGRREIGLITKPAALEEKLEEILEAPARILPVERVPFAPDVRKIVARVQKTIREEMDREIERRRQDRDDEQAIMAAVNILFGEDDG